MNAGFRIPPVGGIPAIKLAFLEGVVVVQYKNETALWTLFPNKVCLTHKHTQSPLVGDMLVYGTHKKDSSPHQTKL